MHDMRLPVDVDVLGLPEAPATPALPVEAMGLRFACDGTTLLDIPRLSIRTRGPTVVLGPNGAGKSVLVRLLHGLIPATSGEVRIAGRVPGRDERARQAMVFQRPVLLRRSVMANMTFALRARGVARAERPKRARALLELAGLADRARQPARALSGGEEQRLALVCALAGQPELLFLDEPTSNLDPGATHRIEQLIAEADQAGTKVILVTHDLGQARRLGDEVIFLRRGQITEQTPAAEFFRHPRSPEARAFVAGHLVI